MMRDRSVARIYRCDALLIGETLTNTPPVSKVSMNLGRPIFSVAWLHTRSFVCASTVPLQFASAFLCEVVPVVVGLSNILLVLA